MREGGGENIKNTLPPFSFAGIRSVCCPLHNAVLFADRAETAVTCTGAVRKSQMTLISSGCLRILRIWKKRSTPARNAARQSAMGMLAHTPMVP